MYSFMPDSESTDTPSKALVYRWGNQGSGRWSEDRNLDTRPETQS